MVVGEFTQETDLVIIGGGPAGYSAAFRAAELGVQTVIVDSRPALGGVCLHDGCVPSKTLLHIAESINLGEHASQFGVSFAKPKIDFKAIRGWTDKAVSKLAAGLESLCKKHGVERIQGQAHFEDSRNIALLDASVPRIRFRRALIATGAAPKVHANVPFDGNRILTAGETLKLDTIPSSLLIFGSDYMAVELATIFASLGSAVTLVYEDERLLPECDVDLARPVQKALERGLKGLYSGVSVGKADVDSKAVRVTFQGEGAPKPAKFDRVIVTAGHVGNTRGLQLEKTSVHVDENGFTQADSQMRTSDPRIFAAGDVTGPPLLADKAMHQGRVAAEAIAGKDSVHDARAIPMAIFTDPQIAWCGMREMDATDQDSPVDVAKIPWGASGRAVGMGHIEGMTKLMYERESKLVLGVGMVGHNASEMIGEAALAIEMGATLTDFALTIHPHPTCSELIADAARQAE
jgi:dihydrolipoamide dehydrogenase